MPALTADVGWFRIALIYVAFSFLLLSIAYAGAGPSLLLKKASGRRSMWAWILFCPYFFLNALTFGVYRLVSREPAYVQVAPNLYFGRWLCAGDCKALPFVGVLDLAAEFAESPPLRKLQGYKSLPVLDATAPTDNQLRCAMAWIDASLASGPVYVHCALGHGRSATVIISYLLSTGIVLTIEDGERLLQSLRAGVRLNRAQRQRLATFGPRARDQTGTHLPPPAARRGARGV